METEQSSLTELFSENGYTVVDSGELVTVKKKSPSFLILAVLSILFGVLLLYISYSMSLDYRILLGGFIFIGFPFIYERWKYPNQITVDANEKSLILKSGLAYVQKFRFSDISSLEVDESVVTSDVSPFKDGYQDFIYDFRLIIGRTKLKLINVMFRKASDDEIKILATFFTDKLQISSK